MASPIIPSPRTVLRPSRSILFTNCEAALRSVLVALGGRAKVEELYRLFNAAEAASFLGLAEPTVRDMTYRNELPYVKVGTRAVRYRVIDLIAWTEHRACGASTR
jgi:excisionase family DNA binding protein